MKITELAISNRTSIVVLTVLLVIAGVYSYFTLPRESAPDVPVPFVLVSTVYEGVSPEDVESAVTMKIEKEMAGVKGVKEVTSTSAEGMSVVAVEFLPDLRVEDALQYVRDKVDQAKGELPQDAEEPVISEINIAEFPIMYINISGQISQVLLKAIADELEDTIETVPGVLGVDVLGALEREIRMEIDQDRVAAYGLTIPELLRLIPAENVNVSAGGLETPGTRFNVRVPAEFVNPDEVDTLLLSVRDGKPIYLKDVAQVRDTFKDRSTYSRLDGVPSITLSIQKRVGANIIPIAQTVKAILERARQQAPQGVEFSLTLDRSEDIDRMVGDLENNIITGAILVMLVLMLFMGTRVSAIVAIAMPLSMLMGFVIIQMLGYTLNMIVLFSLILAIGMLVDNAIVIVENIYRHMQLGYSRMEAARKGAAEVALPITTSTLTTVAAFLPLIFWPGIMGDFMKYLPITVMITLSCSLFVALVINPTLSSAAAPMRARRAEHKHWFMAGYRRFLRASLDYWYVTLGTTMLLLVMMVALYAQFGRGVEFFPEIDPRRAIINLRLPQGTNIEQTNQIALEVERRVERYRPSLEHVVANVGSEGGMNLEGGNSSGPHVANITLLFPEYAIRKSPSADVVALLRQDLADIAGTEINVDKEKGGPPTGEAVSVRVIGKDFKVLGDLSDRVRAAIASVPGLVNVRSDLEDARPELSFHVDRRRAMLLGVNTALVGNFLKTAVFGNKVGIYRQYNDEYDITVRLPVEQRRNIEDLLRLQIPNDRGKPVPLSSLGEFSYAGGFGTIHHVDQNRVVTINGGAEGRLSTDVLKDVQARLATMELPPGYEIRYAGEKEDQDEASLFLGKAFVVALLLVTLVLVAEFNTLVVPMVIMSTVVLSLIGVLMGLLINNLPFGIIMTGIGVISLAGVVVNNGIVLLEYVRQLQREGKGLKDALVEAGATRLRPVMLTAVTTVMGLIPMAVGISFDFRTFELATRSESSEWWRGMAIAVIYGLSVATALTLVVVPSLYMVLYRLMSRMGFGGLHRPGEEVVVPAAQASEGVLVAPPPPPGQAVQPAIPADQPNN